MSDFLNSTYLAVNQARADWLNMVFKQLNTNQLKTALDVGCGDGFFASFLHQKGMEVTGVDLQQCNIDTCRKKCPEGHFETLDLDGQFEIEKHDLVLIFGLLYHLQSPYRTIKMLAPSIGKIALVSTVTAPGEDAVFKPYYEGNGDSQNVSTEVSLVPTWKAIYETFHSFGFHIYTPPQPNHGQWRRGDKGGFRNARRVAFVVSRGKLKVNWPLYQATGMYSKWN